MKKHPALTANGRTRMGVAWLAILAIVWHAFMPLAHAASAERGQDFGSICFSGGFSDVPANGPLLGARVLAPDGRDIPAADLVKQCPLCAAGAHAFIAGNPDSTFIADDRLSHAGPVSLFRHELHGVRWLAFSPRAPPRD